MFLFIISFLLIFLSSYLITSIISPKKSILGLLYLFINAFAQIVVTFELLSLFNAIKPSWVLLCNLLVLLISNYVWLKKSKQFWSIDLKSFKQRLDNSFRLDKALFILYIAFLILVITSIILCLTMPVTSADAQSYHVARSLYWVLNGNLNFIDNPDIRSLCLPINSEILYSWVILFTRKDIFFGLFSFVGYFLSIISLFNILGYLGYCYRKRLWTIFILSSFASVIVQISGTETDIIIAGLILTSIFLFWNALKTNNKVPIFMAALAYALAIGTKTPSLIMMPGIGLLMFGLCSYYKNFRPFLTFLLFGFINFLIFASFNYIQNYIHFGNFLGSEYFMVVSKNYYGIKGLFANFIKYIFIFFDFTGLKWADYCGSQILHARTATLNFFHLGSIPDGMYTIPFVTNRTLLEPLMGGGILGFLVFLPCLIWALIKPIFTKKSKKTMFLFAFAAIFVVNIIFMSYSLAYMAFSVRFIMSFMVLSSPILVYSYLSNKNIFKYIIIIFSIFYMVFVSTHLWARPFIHIGEMLIKGQSLSEIREKSTCLSFQKNPQIRNSACMLKYRIQKKFSKENKILVFMSSSDYIYEVKKLNLSGYKIDIGTLEDASQIDFNKYNLIILPNITQVYSNIKDYENRKKYYTIKNNKVIILKRALVPCYYVKNKKIPDYQNKAPYQTICFVTEPFLKLKKLELIGVSGVILGNEPIKSSTYFLIYQNKNKPAIYAKTKK